MMMRTIEVLLSVTILFAAFMVISYFAVLPSPRLVSSPNLSDLASSTLNTLDSNGELSKTAFASLSDPSWANLQNALTASLPPNIVYNFSVYNIVTSASGVTTYGLVKSFADSQGGLGATSYSSSLIVTSSNVTFTATPQKIGQSYGKNITLYILNCNDANGWWITGYTGQSLASDLYNLLSPYFQETVLVNSTYQLGQLLNGTRLTTNSQESIQNAVVINTFGEAVPIPAGYYNKTGYDSKDGSYANYTHTLGLRVNTYNWTWVSIVGYPFYYVTNTKTFSTIQNTWGIYGMQKIGPPGLNAFLEGLANQPYSYNTQDIHDPNSFIAHFTSNASYYSNYYGVYPSPYQTATRALPTSILSTYHLNVLPNSYIFNVYQGWIAGATYNYIGSDGKIHGSFTAIGLTRIPDIRIAALGLLQFYRPTIYKSQYGASGTSRLVVLQLAQQGGT